MRNRPTNKSFRQTLKDSQQSTNDTIDVMRRLSQSTNALKYLRDDAEYESLHGPRTMKQKFWLGLSRLGHYLGREFSYLGFVILKIVLVGVFNFVAVFGFFWLLSLL